MNTYKNCLILAIFESISPRQAISVAFEMPLRMPWIPMLLEWIGALPEPALRHDPSVLTLFVCALEADALLLETWRRVPRRSTAHGAAASGRGLWPLRRGPGRVHALRGRSAQRDLRRLLAEEEQGASPEEAIQAARRPWAHAVSI